MEPTPDAYVAELVTNLVEASGSRRVRELAAAGDEAAIVGKRHVDALVSARDLGEWDDCEIRSRQLLAWLVEQSKGMG